MALLLLQLRDTINESVERRRYCDRHGGCPSPMRGVTWQDMTGGTLSTGSRLQREHVGGGSCGINEQLVCHADHQ